MLNKLVVFKNEISANRNILNISLSSKFVSIPHILRFNNGKWYWACLPPFSFFSPDSHLINEINNSFEDIFNTPLVCNWPWFFEFLHQPSNCYCGKGIVTSKDCSLCLCTVNVLHLPFLWWVSTTWMCCWISQ